jgi:membrane protein
VPQSPDSTASLSPPITLTALRHVAVDSAFAWSDRRASSKGAALALYTLFSLAPILLLVTAAARVFFGPSTVREQMIAQIRDLVGDQGAAAVSTILSSAPPTSSNVTAAAISFAIVLISATTAFAELKTSLDDLWQLPPSKGNGIWLLVRERFLSLGLLLVLALLMLVSLAVAAVIAALQSAWGTFWGHTFIAETAVVFSEIFSFLIIVVLFSAIYKLLPDTAIAWRDVVPGAVFTAILFTLGKAAIGLYLGHGGVTTGYGAAGSFVALILWVYYSAQIFFYGALFTHEWTFRLGSRWNQPRQEARVTYVDVQSDAAPSPSVPQALP